MNEKIYYTQYGVGRSRYVVSYHDGQKVHKDGSKFFDIAICKSRRQLDLFLMKLKDQGYKHR